MQHRTACRTCNPYMRVLQQGLSDGLDGGDGEADGEADGETGALSLGR